MENEGRKYDQGKERWGLLPWEEVRDIVKVLTVGAVKYNDNNWIKVPNAESRYFDALHRHLQAWKSGEKNDQDDGLPHLAHAGCCLLFLMWFDKKAEMKT